MIAIILASGEGSRLRPLTITTPKPLTKILGKTLIEHNLENLSGLVSKCIIITKYKHELFPEILGNNYKNIQLHYHIQGEKKGTAGALKGLGLSPEKKYIILYGDSIYSQKDLEYIINAGTYGCFVKEVENPKIYGIFRSKDSKAIEVIEKPKEHVGNLANMAGYIVDGSIEKLCSEVPISSRGEYEITDAINMFIKANDFYLYTLKEDIIDIGYPWNILDTNTYFLEQLSKSQIDGIVEDNVTIKGNIILREGAIIKSGTYIEGNSYFGKNSTIGPNAYVRGNTSLGEGGKIGFSVEVKNSHIGEYSKIPHLSYIGDSIIGNNVNLGGGTSTANLRHDEKNIKVPIKGELIDTGKRKLGTIVGDNVQTGMNTSIYPGRVLQPGTTTLPGEIIT